MKSPVTALPPKISRATVTLALLVFAGCQSASPPPAQTNRVPAEESQAEELPQVEPSAPIVDTPEETAKQSPNAASNSAALVLLAKSEKLRVQGKLPQAVALVERAIRLEPSRGDLWIQLGQLRYDEGEHSRAEQYARKGIALTPAGDKALGRGWLLLADISEARGDVDGAAQIRRRWLNDRG